MAKNDGFQAEEKKKLEMKRQSGVEPYR